MKSSSPAAGPRANPHTRTTGPLLPGIKRVNNVEILGVTISGICNSVSSRNQQEVSSSSAANPPAAIVAVDRCDRQTDGYARPLYRPAAHTTRTAASVDSSFQPRPVCFTFITLRAGDLYCVISLPSRRRSLCSHISPNQHQIAGGRGCQSAPWICLNTDSATQLQCCLLRSAGADDRALNPLYVAPRSSGVRHSMWWSIRAISVPTRMHGGRQRNVFLKFQFVCATSCSLSFSVKRLVLC